MIRYLKESYCSGLPPARVSVSGMYERNALISRMMLDRSRIRLLCAPAMMGKTMLAYQYARLVFSFEKVLWLDASHPCLLKGLYDGNLCDGICSVICDGSLVIFDDVPRLSERSRLQLQEVCSSLLNMGVEVIVACSPDCDPFVDSKANLVAFSSEDLLYSDDEFEELCQQGYLPKSFQGVIHKAERVPGLLNNPMGGVERFLVAQQNEFESVFQKLLTYALILLSSGTVDDLSLVMGRPVSSDDLKAPRVRPYVTLTNFGEAFCAEGFPQGDVIRALNAQLQRICANSQEIVAEQFISNLADLLISYRSVDKATRLMVEACGHDVRAQWAERHTESMIEMSAPLHVSVLYKSLESQGRRLSARFCLCNAIAHLLFCEESFALNAFKMIASNPDNSIELRVRAATYAALSSADHPSEISFGESFGSDCLELRRKGKEKGALQILWNAILDGDSGIIALIANAEIDGYSSDWLLAAACCVRGVMIQQSSKTRCLEDTRNLPCLLDCIGLAIERCVGKERSESRLYLLKRELDMLGSGPHFSRPTMLYIDQIEARIRSQRASFNKLPTSAGWDRGAFVRPQTDGLHFRMSASSVMSVPLLEIKMFGRFEVRIGGQAVDQRFFSRLKTRSLLVLLALDAGKDISCDRLASLLWPDSTEEKARRNFYSIFSMLKRSLTLQDGSCPYVIRTQGVCRLSSPFMKSDANDLAEICQQMRYGSLRVEDAIVLLERVKDVYQGELIPSERVVPSIESARSAWKGRIVDALLIASSNLHDHGYSSVALDYAQFALRCDTYREDVYEAIMSLQYIKMQRHGAIETYFEYQRMNRDLGLDPSSRMIALYESIIGDEELPRGIHLQIE